MIVEALAEFAWRLGHWAYLLIFLAAMLETSLFVGLVVPGDTVAILAGVLVSAEVLDMPETLTVAFAGAVVGDSIGYELGRHLGRPWLLRHGHRFGFHRRVFARLERLFARHGGKAIVIARFIGFVRALAPFVAGSSRMPYRWFLLFNLVGAALWAVAYVSLGYLVGESWRVAERWVGRVGVVAAVVVVTLAVLTLRRWSRRRADAR
ncbi:MAG TPA: DedA family protein [Candidatus Binatia bacterium]|nr:DedA family protein [Candidatus Binatia bacterium]